MTTLFQPDAASTPAIADTPRSERYPPSFADITRTLLREVLDSDYPLVAIEIDATWLFCRDRRLPPDTQTPPAVYTLVDSLVEFFTGGLNWIEAEMLGLYDTASPASTSVAIAGLEPETVISLYAHMRQRLDTRFTQELGHYWEKHQPNGKTRRATFIEQRIQTLKLEAQMHVDEDEMGSELYYMLDTALKLSTDQTQDGLQPHGVYSLSLIAGSNAPMDLRGAFVLTSVHSYGLPASDNQSLGVTLLYTPDTGLEHFDSLKQLTEALNQRLLNTKRRASLLTALDLHALAQLDKDGPTQALQWQYMPLGGDFMSLLFTQQLIKQKTDFAQAVAQARAVEMDYLAFEKLITQVLAPHQHFANHRHLQRHDSQLVEDQMPDWWKSMGSQQRSQWLDHTRQFAQNAIELHRSTVMHFKDDAFNPETFVRNYIDSQLDEGLKKLSVTLPPERIKVNLWYDDASFQRVGFPLSSSRPSSHRCYSLKHLVHERADVAQLSKVISMKITDDWGATLEVVTPEFVRELIEQINVPAAFDRFMDLHLKTSPYAQQLRQTQGHLMLTQMRMALLELEQQPFPERASKWLRAVLDAPNPGTRLKVGNDSIEVRFLKIHNIRLTNILLVTSAGKLESGGVLLCSFGAPDGIVLRWYESLFHLKSAFLEQEKFLPYLAQQITAPHRPTSLGILEYDKWLKYWRLPDAMRFLAQPLPIPTVAFHPVTFALQTKSFLDENHDIKIEHLIIEAQTRLLADIGSTASTGETSTADIITNIALLFLPPPIMLPMVLGEAFYQSWSGFRKFEADDIEGATQEFLSALGYVAAAQAGSLLQPDQPAALIEEQTSRPHLVRTTGRDGQKQIGYLLSPNSPPHLPNVEDSIPINQTLFQAITLDDEACYVSRRFNLFGHSRLYRLDNSIGNMLVHADKYVMRNSKGVWRLAGGHAPQLTPSAEKAAKSALRALLDKWPATEETVNNTEKARFVAGYTRLSRLSNSEFFPEILAYSEGGSVQINQLLRAGIRNATTRQFLMQFYQLRECRDMAFRAAYVSTAGLERLQQQIGAVFADSGVQSASISRINATRWSQDSFVTQNATRSNCPVFLIFDDSITKKNMYANFLGDHVAIPPTTRLQLQAVLKSGDRFYAYFAAPQRVAREVYDLYSGEKELMV